MFKVEAGAMNAKTEEEIRQEQEARYQKCNVRWSDREGGNCMARITKSFFSGFLLRLI
jgi:hypothetical protein